MTGPVYAIFGQGQQLAQGDRLMRIRVVETGEESDDRCAENLDDSKVLFAFAAQSKT
jgi:hypothetical protein